MSKRRYGWYSKRADKLSGHSVYLDRERIPVKVTEVLDDINHDPVYSDAEYVGCVYEFVETSSSWKGITTWTTPIKNWWQRVTSR